MMSQNGVAGGCQAHPAVNSKYRGRHGPCNGIPRWKHGPAGEAEAPISRPFRPFAVANRNSRNRYQKKMAPPARGPARPVPRGSRAIKAPGASPGTPGRWARPFGMARGTVVNAESPGSRRGLVWGRRPAWFAVHASPAREPGDTGPLGAPVRHGTPAALSRAGDGRGPGGCDTPRANQP
jgi:hypothetical protein